MKVRYHYSLFTRSLGKIGFITNHAIMGEDRSGVWIFGKVENAGGAKPSAIRTEEILLYILNYTEDIKEVNE